jgi:AcrR family transcriptional regulator
MGESAPWAAPEDDEGGMPRGPGRPRVPAFSRQELAEAVVDLVCERGYAGWSLRDLARRLGVSTGTLTHHYGNKELLAIAAMDTVYIIGAEWNQARSLSPMGRLRWWTKMFVLDTERGRRWWLFWLEYMAAATHDIRLRARHEERFTRQKRFFASLIGSVMAEGPPGLEGSPEREAAALLSLGNGLGAQQIGTPRAVTPEQARAVLETYLDDLHARILNGGCEVSSEDYPPG